MTIRVLQLINLVLFVFAAAFLVLHVEFDDGNFLYYFFKAKVYYSVFNKIIFPVGFWGCFALFYAFYYLLNQKKEGSAQKMSLVICPDCEVGYLPMIQTRTGRSCY